MHCWWGGLFLVYLLCECWARVKFMSMVGSQRTRRAVATYAIGHAVGVSLFWVLQTLISVIVVSVSFPSEHSQRWGIILYCAVCLTILRNFTLNTLGAAFIAKLSGHFYLEDMETREGRTDQQLLTQLSIMSSYSSLYYLFTKTVPDDWSWVAIGIVVYQLILLLMDMLFPSYLRPKMLSLLKGELIAWLAVGARSVVNVIFPFGGDSVLEREFDSNWPRYMRYQMGSQWRYNLAWLAVFMLGPTLLLLLLWLRVHRIWTYEEIESHWDDEDFSFHFFKSAQQQQALLSAVKRQRNRLMIVCALTIGFIVSVTEATSLWFDDPNTRQYEGMINLA